LTGLTDLFTHVLSVWIVFGVGSLKLQAVWARDFPAEVAVV